MPSDPRLEDALALAARIGRLRAAANWTIDKVETGPEAADEDGENGFILVIYLRYDEWEEQPGIGFKTTLDDHG